MAYIPCEPETKEKIRHVWGGSRINSWLCVDVSYEELYTDGNRHHVLRHHSDDEESGQLPWHSGFKYDTLQKRQLSYLADSILADVLKVEILLRNLDVEMNMKGPNGQTNSK